GRAGEGARGQGWFRVPELPAVAVADCTGERDAAAGAARRRRCRNPGARHAGEGGAGRGARPLPAPAVRRRTAARGAGARLRHRAVAAAGRRAHRQPRHPHRRGGDRTAVRDEQRRRHHAGAGDPRRTPRRALRPRAAPGRRPAGGRMNTLRLAWRQLRRDLASGDIRILVAELWLAVVAVTVSGFVTDRAERALATEANRLLGGDAVLRGDQPIEGELREAAGAPGLAHTETVEFQSMIRVGEGADANLRLGDPRALGEGFPLRGRFTVDDAGGEHEADGIPAPGTLWMSRAGADLLGARLGDAVSIGQSRLTLAALVVQEPDAAMDYFNVAPKVFLNLGDLPATQLVQEGSRVRYRLVVAGDATAVERFTAIAKAALGRGQRLETIADARPEIRSALDRAGRFLGLAALVSVVLAAVAVAMAARRHGERHLSGAAVMRCLGASQRTLVGIHVGEMVLLGLLASVLGVAIAFALQWAVGAWLERALGLSIPPAGWLPALQGLAVGMIVLLAFAAPPVLALRRVSALRVLRR